MLRRLIPWTLTAAIALMPVAAFGQADGEESPPPPPPESWKPAGEITPPAPTAAAETQRIIPSPMIEYGEFRLNIHGLVQVLAGLVGEDANLGSGDVLNRDGFRIRRARLGLDGRLLLDWEYNLELDLIDEDSGGNALLDAQIRWKPCEWGWVKIGAGKPGFSRTLLASSGELQLIERPLWVNLERATKTTMLDLDHQVGLSVGGRVSLFFYELGAYNGSPGFSKGDWNDGLMYVLRLGAGMGELGRGEADHQGGDLRWQVGLNGYLNYGAAAEYRGAGIDLAAKWAGLSFYAEALWAKAVPDAQPVAGTGVLAEAERWGMYAQAGYLLPLDLGFMSLEVAARFAMMDDQVHIDDEGDIWELAAGVNAYFFDDQLKLMIDYIRRQELHGADLSNDLLAALLQLQF